MSANLRWRLQT